MMEVEKRYHEDVLIFFSIDMLEGILELFKHARHLKGGGHRIMSLGNCELVFNSGDCSVRERRQSEEKPLTGEEPPTGEGRKRGAPLFKNKHVSDEQELIGEEIAKCLYGGRTPAKGAHKHKLVTAVVIQAILFANRIGLDVHKLNLLLSIILMTMRRIGDNVKEKKGRKKKTINYFSHLMSKNVCYGWVEDPTGEGHLNRDVPQQGGCTSVEGESCSMSGNNFVRPSNGDGSKAEEHTTSIKEPTGVNMKKKTGAHKEKANGMGTNDAINKQTEDKEETPPLEADEHRPVCTQVILFEFEEAKKIIKYIFENIFSIYSMIEYLFLFSPVCVHVVYGGGFSAASPPGCLFASDELKLGEAANPHDEQGVGRFNGAEDDELATNIFIKEALDVPLSVLNKFYASVDQLRRKMDEVLV
ncbi:conserved Plasmodium protein, unknown function [Plasmodium vivax]|uniref:Uncharacterized protein n=1 Tax=Plasmodium vivax TaxID=5855 RepID=A0A564ZRG0_PLAVI|nr:conserved Plasmodium protein, unknown function [Plasmodium vivax]